jgi:hypothetical protein
LLKNGKPDESPAPENVCLAMFAAPTAPAVLLYDPAPLVLPLVFCSLLFIPSLMLTLSCSSDPKPSSSSFAESSYFSSMTVLR